MAESRNNPRYQTLAIARISGHPEYEGLLKNISVTGCCVEYTVKADILPHTQYKLEIVPEKGLKIDNFELLVEQKWIRSDGYSTDVGFIIDASPKGKHFQDYVDYLSYHNPSP
jgi:hypothetical protein